MSAPALLHPAPNRVLRVLRGNSLQLSMTCTHFPSSAMIQRNYAVEPAFSSTDHDPNNRTMHHRRSRVPRDPALTPAMWGAHDHLQYRKRGENLELARAASETAFPMHATAHVRLSKYHEARLDDSKPACAVRTLPRRTDSLQGCRIFTCPPCPSNTRADRAR